MNKIEIIKSMNYINGDPEILPFSFINNQLPCRPNYAMGQIKLNTNFGKEINKIAKNKKYNKYLEIGPCCGLGTTKCLLDGIILRDDNSYLISYESNLQFYTITKKYWEKYFEIYNINKNKFKLYNGSLISYDELDDNYVTSSGKTKEEYDYNIDIKNGKIDNCNENIDVLCLDGGHFSTNCEWNKFKNNIKIIILDDIYSSKTKNIYDEIKNDSNWNILYKSNDRGGELIAKKNTI